MTVGSVLHEMEEAVKTDDGTSDFQGPPSTIISASSHPKWLPVTSFRASIRGSTPVAPTVPYSTFCAKKQVRTAVVGSKVQVRHGSYRDLA